MTSVACPPGTCEMGQGCGGPGSTDTPCGSCCDCRGCAALALLVVADTPLSRVERFLNILPPGEPVLTAVVVDDESTVVTLHTSDVRAVIADLWAARDLAFRAAFASAEGEHYEWGVATAGLQHEPLVGQQGLTEEAARRYAVVSNHPHVVQRLIGPWKFAPSVPQEKP